MSRLRTSWFHEVFETDDNCISMWGQLEGLIGSGVLISPAPVGDGPTWPSPFISGPDLSW